MRPAAHLYRPTYTRPIPAKATRFDADGVPSVRWKNKRGETVTARVSESDPARCIVTVGVWWCKYKDHTGEWRFQECFADHKRSLRELAAIEDREQKIRSGDITPAAARRDNRTVDELLEEWREEQLAADLSPKQVDQNLSRVGKIREGIGATRLIDFTAPSVGKCLKHWRDTKKRFSPQTSNHYLVAVRNFINWCLDPKGYLEADPMRGAEPVECESRRTYERRAMTQKEFSDLLTATRAHKIHKCPLSGADRAALYLTAAYTGLRLRELSHLTRDSFRLAASPPEIVLPGRFSKNKEAVVQPIPAAVAAELAAWLATRPAGKPVWPGYNWRTGKAVKLLRSDLKAAKVAAETAEGRIDFHALRTHYITSLARAGVPIQHAQRLARHKAPQTTTKHYTKLGINDLGEQVAKLPPPPTAG